MNRRTLLGRFVFGAAAVLGCGMVAPKAEAAEIDSAPIFGPDMQWTGYVIRADYESGLDTWSVSPPVTGNAPSLTDDDGQAARIVNAYLRGYNVASARAESRLAEGLPIERGALEDVEIGEWQPGTARAVRYDAPGGYARIEDSRIPPFERGALTFEEMVDDCAARGCRLELHAPDDGWQLLSHYPGGVHTQANLEYRGGLDTVYERVDRWRTSLHEAAVRQKDLGTQVAESRRLRGARPFFFTD